MNQDQQIILEYYNNPTYKIIKTFNGEDAWKYILQIRYQPGHSRAHMKRLWKNFDQINAFLVIFTINDGDKPIKICAHYYANITQYNDPPEIGEGDKNMFSDFDYESLELSDAPKVLKTLIFP